MTRHDETRSNYDRLSRWYDFLSGSSERPARLRGLQMLDIRTGDRILEIGCGTGESLSVLDSCVGSTGKVFGLDLSTGMLGAAKDKVKRFALSNVGFIQGDGLYLPFPEESFDAIFMSFTLELLPVAEIPIVLQECKRVLRDSGRMGIVSLLQSESPTWMEKLYVWTHRHYPRVVDCRPIPIRDIVSRSGFDNSQFQEMSMWGLAVGILIASKTVGSGLI
jgi:demethylmenaquinone methyltransferase/2-methoxy-6-polyprenyl-1,4-benzoquinol methylase